MQTPTGLAQSGPIVYAVRMFVSTGAHWFARAAKGESRRASVAAVIVGRSRKVTRLSGQNYRCSGRGIVKAPHVRFASENTPLRLLRGRLDHRCQRRLECPVVPAATTLGVRRSLGAHSS